MAGLSCEGLVQSESAWMSRGACRGTDVDLFFVTRGGDPSDALQYCNRCEVKAECLNYAVTNGIALGIWGGTTPRARRYARSAGRDRYFTAETRARIVWLGRHGWTNREIATEFNVTERTIFRVIAKERARG